MPDSPHTQAGTVSDGRTDLEWEAPTSLAGQIRKTFLWAALVVARVGGASALTWMALWIPFQLLGRDPVHPVDLHVAMWLSLGLTGLTFITTLARTLCSPLTLEMLSCWRRLPDDRLARFSQLATMFLELGEHRRKALAGRGYITRQDLRLGEFLQRNWQSRYAGGPEARLKDIGFH